MMRGLRLRLTVSFLLFFAIVLSGVGFVFRSILSNILNSKVEAILEEEWGAVKGYLRVERGAPKWVYDREDPEESGIVERLQSVYLLADGRGNVLDVSDSYRALGVESAEEIRRILDTNRTALKIKPGPDGTPFMVRASVLVDERVRLFVAFGRSLESNAGVVRQFTTYYFALLPLLLLFCGGLGWFVSSRALLPVKDLASKTETISSSNLSLRIPSRGSGDEIDGLISNFNRMVERLEQSFDQTRQFSTDVSHELRTPLTIIRGQIEVALLTSDSVEQYREAMLNALQEVERLSNTVRALLHLSQAESGQLTLQRQSVDLVEVVREMSEQFDLLAEPREIEYSFNVPPTLRITADKVQIERLLSNLVSNAIKYTDPGGRVDVTLTAVAGGASMIVSDTGRGIPAGDLPHIFDRFYRVPNAVPDPEKGLGLGLSFVAWIVRAHGGSVHVESEPGRGTRFEVFLPQAPSVDPAVEALKDEVGVTGRALQ